MKKYKIIVCMIAASTLLLGNVSCSKWLQVETQDRIMEDNLFRTPEGFLVALNGIYIESIRYFQNQFVKSDILAQYWDTSDEKHDYHKLGILEYGTKSYEFKNIWSDTYKLMVNINTILEHCEKDRAILSQTQYNIYKGEALAMRALFHFEVFKIYCPSPTLGDDNAYMTYATSSEIRVEPFEKSSVIISKILNDLYDAEKLLQESDPIITKGPLASLDENLGNALRFRNFRLNYYAVKALIARISLYVGEKETALKYSSQVIDSVQVKNKYFPFNSQKSWSTKDSEDRVAALEILFGTYNLKRSKDIFDTYYNAVIKNKSSVISLSTDARNELYDNLSTDYRSQYLWESRKSADNENIECFLKYERAIAYNKLENPLEFQYYVPIIRISEMYLIKAECLAETDPDKSYEVLNAIRLARNIPDVDLSSGKPLMEHIQREFAREFIGEGQLFWFYKRLNYKTIPYYGKKRQPSGEYESVAMDGDQYKFPIPNEELNQRK